MFFLTSALAITNSSKQETSFIKTPLEYLEWSYRSPLIVNELTRCQPDVICLQEVDHFFDQQLHLNGYDGLFVPKKDSPCLYSKPNNGPDGCAILYNNRTMTLKCRKDLTLRDTSNKYSHQVACLAMFEFKGHTLCIGATHLKAKPGYENLRLAQGLHVMEEMKEFSNSTYPFIICGDFNAKPSEQFYSAFNSLRDPPLKSAYTASSESGQEPPFTTLKYRQNGQIKYTGDYIWYDSSQIQVAQLYNLLSEEEIGPNGLPSERYPSDHMALCAELALI